jgi:plastocyanin
MTRIMSRVAVTAMLVAGSLAVHGAISMPAARAGGGCHTEASTAKGISVQLSELCFQPTVLYARAGQAVTWTNMDAGTAHNVTGVGFSWASNGDLFTGGSFTHRFDEEGVYPYACTIHPGMVGAVVVGTPSLPGTSVGSLAPPVPTPGQAEPGAQPSVDRETPNGFWRMAGIVAGALAVAASALFGLQLLQRRRSRTASAG